MKQLIIIPGGYHPYHIGHKSIYNNVKKNFPKADVFVASTDDVTKRPFPFKDKEFLASQLGIPKDRFIQVKSPYVSSEITKDYDKEDTVLIFALSEKDADRISYNKKDGSPGYFQKWNDNNESVPLSKHGYVYIVPKISFSVGGENIDSASKIRSMYRSASSDKEKLNIINDLYKNAKNPTKIKEVLDKNLAECISFNSFKQMIIQEKHALGYQYWGWITPDGKLIEPEDTDYTHKSLFLRAIESGQVAKKFIKDLVRMYDSKNDGKGTLEDDIITLEKKSDISIQLAQKLGFVRIIKERGSSEPVYFETEFKPTDKIFRKIGVIANKLQKGYAAKYFEINYRGNTRNYPMSHHEFFLEYGDRLGQPVRIHEDELNEVNIKQL